ncbi:MAG: ferrous iron transporter B, partial [Oscillospiraceae bacterium]|nr:ferrous iron transporter B [Oscillospiraceae bacterium]
MKIRIALAGNPNSGKTTLFNALTGANQFVGNWPGVTVEKKGGKLKKHNDVEIVDLPGIYSLSPYTLEEVVARNFLINERPDVILNIVDGTNLERNLYLTTQLIELGIPVVVAINMMDVVKKKEDHIRTEELSRQLGCKMVEISALKGHGTLEAAEEAIKSAKKTNAIPQHEFSGPVEHALAHIEEAALHDMKSEQQRWYAIKIFERDERVLTQLNLSKSKLDHIEMDIQAAEKELDDDAESIITNERYLYIASLMKGCYKKKSVGQQTVSDKIDKVVTNRILALPIFAVVMFIVYFVSVTTVGTWATDWANDGVFGEGWHLFTIGSADYEAALEEYVVPGAQIEAFEATAEEAGLKPEASTTLTTTAYLYDDDGNVEEEIPVTYADYTAALEIEEPDPAAYGVWVPGIPVLARSGLEAVHCADWLRSLILDGIIAGVGAVLGFVPQMLVLFLFLAFLEGCGYMSRIAFVMDRIFRKFGLSGKSFIPMLIGTGCGIPGIMASRTIENEQDRRMTIMTTTFIPCGAKLPIIALIAGALLGGAWWVAPSAYLVGIVAIVLSGVMLKKTKMFSGDPAPFIMELPAYHWPTVSNILRSMWERAWSFI